MNGAIYHNIIKKVVQYIFSRKETLLFVLDSVSSFDQGRMSSEAVNYREKYLNIYV